MKTGRYHIKVYCSCKIVSNNLKPLSFNQSQVKISGLTLDAKLTFKEYLETKFNSCNRMIGSIKKLSLILPRLCLLTIYKDFVRPHWDHTGIIYDTPDNESFNDWLQKTWYNAVVPVTDAISSTSR